MKKKSTSQSAFFNLRVLIAAFFCLLGVFLALLGMGAFSSAFAQGKGTQNTNQASPGTQAPNVVQMIGPVRLDQDLRRLPSVPPKPEFEERVLTRYPHPGTGQTGAPTRYGISRLADVLAGRRGHTGDRGSRALSVMAGTSARSNASPRPGTTPVGRLETIPGISTHLANAGVQRRPAAPAGFLSVMAGRGDEASLRADVPAIHVLLRREVVCCRRGVQTASSSDLRLHQGGPDRPTKDLDAWDIGAKQSWSPRPGTTPVTVSQIPR